MMDKNILLLSATIKPKSDQPQLILADETERYQEYKKALSFYNGYLQKGVIDSIIFAENSAFDISELKARFPDPNIEWISCYGLDYDSGYHRGYGEFKLIEQVYSVSKTISSADETTAIWKVSGRYILKNISRIIKTAPSQFGLYCDTSEKWSEMSVMAWSNSGFDKYLRPLWPSFATGMAPELILAKKINESKMNDSGIITRFSWPCNLVGRRGTSGKSYQGRFGYLSHLYKIVKQIRK